MGRSSTGKVSGMNERFQARNKEIGELLQAGRKRQNLTISALATYIATTPRRYRMIEAGTAPVHAAELEALVEVLHISFQWPSTSIDTGTQEVPAN